MVIVRCVADTAPSATVMSAVSCSMSMATPTTIRARRRAIAMCCFPHAAKSFHEGSAVQDMYGPKYAGGPGRC